MTRCRDFPPPIVRFSELKKMALSPAHFRAAYEHPTETTPAMLLGTLAHTLILGGMGFAVYEGERRGNKWEDFKSKHAPDVMLVTEKEFAKANRIALAVRSNPVAAPFLVGKKEVELPTWTSLGRKCGGKVDVIGADFIADVKTTKFAQPEAFARDALRRAYHAQLAHYRDGARAADFAVGRVVILAVETVAPYAVTVMNLTDRALLEGQKLLRLWMERLDQCVAAKEWPGYAQSAVDLDVAEDAGLMLDIDGETIEAA